MMADNHHMARVFLTQARATPHAGWRATLIGWAKKRRVSSRYGQQLELFAEVR